MPKKTDIPVIGQDNLGLGAVGIGLLASMDGVGAFCGAVAIALLAKPAIFARLYIGGVVALPVDAAGLRVGALSARSRARCCW